MNKLVARFYSEIIGVLHALFLIGLAVFLFYSLQGYGTDMTRTVLVALGVLVAWVVVFGFITTIVVMGQTIDKMREQMARSELYLKSIAASTDKLVQRQAGQAGVEQPPASREPFIGHRPNAG